MSFYSEAPEYREFRYDKPTLLVCWWVTSLCTAIILLRITGRFIRTERLFLEDRIAALALVPLFLRMGCVHYILLNGTNNINLDTVDLSPQQIRRMEVASGLVIPSRILYAATLWILKNTILEFFRRLTDVTWERSSQTVLVMIRWVLIATFVAIIISDLAECQPFSHYWQVSPDPGGQCRQGYANLLTTAVCNIITDLLLVFFPIPLILRSQMRLKRKLQLTMLFSLSLGVVAITIYRVPHVIRAHGRQQTRSLLASVELLFATTAANALVLGSFMRDRGLKKQKFRRASAADSFDRSSNPRRPTMHRQWGSDEDLVRDLGMGLDPKLRDQKMDGEPRIGCAAGTLGNDIARWQFPKRDDTTTSGQSEDSLVSRDPLARQDSNMMSCRKVSFFDVGGLLEASVETSSSSHRRPSHTSSSADAGPSHAQPSPAVPPISGGFRRGSSALLQDIGGLLDPRAPSGNRDKSWRGKGTELQTITQSRSEQTFNIYGKPDPVLRDPGGLLS